MMLEILIYMTCNNPLYISCTDQQIAARYDPQAEAEVTGWLRQLINLHIEPGMYNLEKALKTGVELIR